MLKEIGNKQKIAEERMKVNKKFQSDSWNKFWLFSTSVFEV